MKVSKRVLKLPLNIKMNEENRRLIVMDFRYFRLR